MPSEFETAALILSLKVSLAALILGLGPAILIAWLLARKTFRGKLLLDGLVHAPLVVPPVVVGYLLLMAFARSGPLGRFVEDQLGLTPAFHWTGAALAAAIMAFPLMVRAIRLSFEAQDPRIAAAARTLGAGRWKAFATISLPMAMPGLVTGALLGFARALGEFGATITFVSNIPGRTQTLPLALYSAAQSPGGEAAAARLMILSLILAFGALILAELWARAAARRTRATW